jgi:hypothetical protein
MDTNMDLKTIRKSTHMDFNDYLVEQGLKKTTITNHLRMISRYTDNYGEPIGNQQDIITNIAKDNTIAIQVNMTGTISKWRQMKKLEVELLQESIHTLHSKFQEDKNKKSLDITLPSVQDIKTELDRLYEDKQYLGYCMLYLFTTFTTRNMDLIANVVYDERDTNATDNWFIVSNDKVIWRRQKYKTFKNYGVKEHTITNEKFLSAIKQLSHIFKENDNIDRVVKKYTKNIGSITEGSICKIMLLENQTAQNYKRISINRGTDTHTLLMSYDISIPIELQSN